MTLNYGRFPIVIERGVGCELFDAEGKRYLDLFAGFGAGVLGHCHPDLVQAVTEQAGRVWHAGNLYHTDPQTRLAQAIANTGFGGRSFFCHSGADANEAAIKLARLYGKANPGKSTGEHGRFGVISCTRSFHGRSFATMAATGNPAVREGFGPYLPGYVNVAYNDPAAVERAVTPETVAVLVEPIQGEGGVFVPDTDYLPKLRELCDKHDLLLICDEVWTGCGRTGKMFAHQHFLPDPTVAAPDVMTLAKGVGGGLALGVCCVHERVARFFDHQQMGRVTHATTLGGNCLTAAVAARIFEVIERDDLLAHATKLGQHATQRLQAFAADHPFITDVRGHGLFLGIELDTAHDAFPFDDGKSVVTACLDRGLMINVAGKGNVIRLAPALTVTQAQLDEGLDTLEAVLHG